MYNFFQHIIPTLAFISSIRANSMQITPGATWTASNYGRHVQAHGAGIIKVGKTYYMIGEDKTTGSEFQNVNCFSSTNLVEWSYVGALLSRTSEAGDLGPNRIIERPKVIYNKDTQKYILYMHIDSMDYSEAKVGIAMGDTVCGNYTYMRSFRPQGCESRDMGLFQEDDGTAYLLAEDRPTGLRIYKLSDDYLSVPSIVYTWHENIESPAVFKRDGTYYTFGSHLSGWSPNDNVYATATSLSGPWSQWQLFAGINGTNTYNSQTTFILPVSKDLVIYMGDRWLEQTLAASTYVWLPLQIDGTKVSMNYSDHWAINEQAGSWARGPNEDVYEAQSAALSGSAKVIDCSGCSSSKAAGFLGGPGNGSAMFPDITNTGSGKKLVRIFAPNGDVYERFGDLSVNGGAPVKLGFLPSKDASTPAISAAMVELKDGINSIKIQGAGIGWGPIWIGYSLMPTEGQFSRQ